MVRPIMDNLVDQQEETLNPRPKNEMEKGEGMVRGLGFSDLPAVSRE